jgi:hypothetical protein
MGAVVAGARTVLSGPATDASLAACEVEIEIEIARREAIG